jgi:HK97 family phage major capsid protein
MPEYTPEQIKQLVKDEVDKHHNQEYETDTEFAEIKAKAGVKSDELSKDSIDRLAADADEMSKKMDELIEQGKETSDGIPVEPPEDEKPQEPIQLGKLMKEVRTILQHGERGPILTAMGDEISRDAMAKEGVPLPKELLKIFDGGSRRKTTGFLEEGQGSQGGFTVPEQFIADVQSFELLPPIMRSRAFTIQATTNVVKMPRIVETDRSSNVHGGVTAYWTAEGGTITKSNPAWGQVALIAKKLALLTYATNELLDDNAVGLNDILIRIFSEALGWFEDKAFINGSGVNEPIGLRQGGAKMASTATTTGAAFLVADACILFAGMMPGTESRGIWLMNPSVRRALPQMVSASGGDNIWYPRNILTIKDSPEPWTLLGMPIFWTEHCAAFGTDEDILLIDPLNYLVMSRQDVRVAVSTDSRFETDETGYKLTMRSDGQNWATSALTLADGSTTVSPVVANNHT